MPGSRAAGSRTRRQRGDRVDQLAFVVDEHRTGLPQRGPGRAPGGGEGAGVRPGERRRRRCARRPGPRPASPPPAGRRPASSRGPSATVSMCSATAVVRRSSREVVQDVGVRRRPGVAQAHRRGSRRRRPRPAGRTARGSRRRWRRRPPPGRPACRPRPGRSWPSARVPGRGSRRCSARAAGCRCPRPPRRSACW